MAHRPIRELRHQLQTSFDGRVAGRCLIRGRRDRLHQRNYSTLAQAGKFQLSTRGDVFRHERRADDDTTKDDGVVRQQEVDDLAAHQD